jgi:hypothetical protein
MFYALCHVVDSFVDLGKNTPKKSPAAEVRRVAPLRKTSRQGIYRNDVARTQAEHKEEFDTGYMRALYRFAFDKAAKGYPWQDGPPGFTHSAH